MKCVIEMTDYTQLQKGLILYQHLAFSEHIAKADIEDLCGADCIVKLSNIATTPHGT